MRGLSVWVDVCASLRRDEFVAAARQEAGKSHDVGACGVRRKVNASGTGSEPPSHNGWQRARRHTARMPPRMAPKRAIATRA